MSQCHLYALMTLCFADLAAQSEQVREAFLIAAILDDSV